MALTLDSSIEQLLGRTGIEITKVIQKSTGAVLWEAYAIGTAKAFDYTGGIQTFIVPATGVYLLETYGAQGGNGAMGSGGKGGYSKGYIPLTKGETLYVVVGGAGKTGANGTVSGGYNGGGSSKSSNSAGWQCGSGGGATHIAKRTGLLSALANYISDILLVAGGAGGGGGTTSGWATNLNGGTGGGTSGGDGSCSAGWLSGKGGTQSAGGDGGEGYYGVDGSFGQGGNKPDNNVGIGAGGGGGLYGGGSGCYYNGGTAAGGGSGYIGGVDNGETTNGQRSGDGYAKITYYSRKSSGIVTYIVDGTEYDVEIAVGSNCLNPTSFTVPTKDGYVFLGWSYMSGGDVLSSCYMGTSDITLYAVYAEATPYYVVFTDYPLTDTSGYNGTERKVETTSGGYYLTVKQNSEQVGHGVASGTVTFPTLGCNKVRIKYTTYIDGHTYTDQISINDTSVTTGVTNQNLYLNCSGDNFTLSLAIVNPQSYNALELRISEIYFYYE